MTSGNFLSNYRGLSLMEPFKDVLVPAYSISELRKEFDSFKQHRLIESDENLPPCLRSTQLYDEGELFLNFDPAPCHFVEQKKGKEPKRDEKACLVEDPDKKGKYRLAKKGECKVQGG